jgi:hypothetical protein
VYDGGSLLAKMEIPANATAWTGSGSGYRYSDIDGSADGATKILLRASDRDRAKIILKGRGAHLPDPALGALPAPIVAQLANDATGICWESSFEAADLTRNDSATFLGKYSR